MSRTNARYLSGCVVTLVGGVVGCLSPTTASAQAIPVACKSDVVFFLDQSVSMNWDCGLCESLLEAMRQLKGTSVDYQFTVYWAPLNVPINPGDTVSPCYLRLRNVLNSIDPGHPSFDPLSPYLGLQLELRDVATTLAVGQLPPACIPANECVLNPADPCTAGAAYNQPELVPQVGGPTLLFPCDENEDWGAVAAYVAQNHPWREAPCQGRRFYIPISDAAPRCGGFASDGGGQFPFCDDRPATLEPPFIGGSDWRITREASLCAIASRMWVMPIVGCKQCNECVECVETCLLPCRTGGGPGPSTNDTCPPANWQQTCVEPAVTSCNPGSCLLEQVRLFSYYTTGVEAFEDGPNGPFPDAPFGIGNKPYLVHPTFARYRTDTNPWINSVTDFLVYRLVEQGCLTPCESLDFNRDGLYPADEDLIDFLSVLAGGPCSNVCGRIDFNADCLFPADEDLIAFLARLAGEPCDLP